MPTSLGNHPVASRSVGWQQVAKTSTEVLAPVPVIAAASVLLGWHAYAWRPVGLGAGLLLAVFGSLIPFVIIRRAVRRGRATDHHIGRREQRRNPLLLACLSMAIGTLAVKLLGAPKALTGAGAGILLAEVLVTVVNIAWWKMSVHSAVAAGCTAILVLTFGPWCLVAVVALAFNGWSRVYLGAHTTTQVVSGALAGALASGALFVLLR
jgi:hypothetical protein